LKAESARFTPSESSARARLQRFAGFPCRTQSRKPDTLPARPERDRLPLAAENADDQ
jgi:hypothetical protein